MFINVMLAFAFVLFVITGLSPWTQVDPHRPRLMALGLACWVAAYLFGGLVR